MDPYHASVTITCPQCRCDNVIEDGWSTVYNSLDNEAANIVGNAWGLKRARNNMTCDGQCPCHTGIGLLPRLHLRIS